MTGLTGLCDFTLVFSSRRSNQLSAQPTDAAPADAPGIFQALQNQLGLRAPEPETGQMMMVVAGLSEKGSSAALEFVTNPKYLDRFAAQAPAGWEHRNIELVIKSNLVNDEWGEPRVVATHLW